MEFNFLWIALGFLVSAQTASYALAALGLAVHFGYTGLLNFGQAGFMLLGGYAYAITAISFGWPAWASFLAAMGSAVLFALVLGIPTLRLRADYLSIVTIAAAEIVRYVGRTGEFRDVTGGSDGLKNSQIPLTDLNPFPPGQYGFGILAVPANQLWIRVVAWAFVILAALLIWQLMRSPWGRVIKGIREDEDAVRSLGKNVYSFKMQSLILGGILGALGGVFYMLPASLQPDSFGTQATFFLYTILLLGGAATVFGPIVGAAVFWVTLTLTDGVLALIVNYADLGISQVQQGQVRYILVGVALALLVVFRPQGIFGKKRDVVFNG